MVDKPLKLEGLNAVRFFAFFWVFCLHTLPRQTNSGNYAIQFLANLNSFGLLGIDLFFVLSSFLLTYLGLAEKTVTGKFSVKNFLVRRSLRIFPLYYFTIGISFLVLPIISRIISNDIHLPENYYFYLFFLSNYDTSDHIYALKFLWSVAVEEQYYWTWAFALLFLQKNFITVTSLFFLTYVFVFFGSPLLNITVPDKPLIYLSDFAIGGAAAILFFYLRKYTVKFIILIPLLVLAELGWWFLRNADIYIAHLFLAIFFAYLLLFAIAICEKPFIRKSYLYRLLDNLGIYTYGLYVYSGFVISLAGFFVQHFNLQPGPFLLFLVECLQLFVIAFASYHLFEKKFLAYSKKFRWRNYPGAPAQKT
jgi:peptidoglycan/LPS O-acetylase OafA/YrhL